MIVMIVKKYYFNCFKAASCSSGSCDPAGDPWFQFTQSPTHFNDIDGDGMNEFITLPNTELGWFQDCQTYVSQYRTLFILNGNYGNGGDPTSTNHLGCLRKTAFLGNPIPPSGNTFACKSCQTSPCNTQSTCIINDYYPPHSVPAIAFADVLNYGGNKKQMIFGFDDGRIVCYDDQANLNWQFSFESDLGQNIQTFYIGNSEPVVADLNGDGNPEVIFNVYGAPVAAAGSNQWLYILNGQTGAKIHAINLNDGTTNPTNSLNGNGYGSFAAPTIADVDGDGTLEIVVNMVDGRVLVFNVPGSQTNCVIWQSGRGGYLRKGQPDSGNY